MGRIIAAIMSVLNEALLARFLLSGAILRSYFRCIILEALRISE